MARLNNSIGKKLLVGIGLPGLLMAVLGLYVLYKRADAAVEKATQDEAVALAELLASDFDLAASASYDRQDPHRLLRETLRANWRVLRNVRGARVVDPSGKIVWARNVEEQGKPLPGGPVSDLHGMTVRMVGNHAEVVRPLGGVACADCHTQGNALRLGALQLEVAQPSLQGEVANAFLGALVGMLVFSLVLGGVTTASLQVFLRWPLKKLTRVMRSAEHGDFLVRAEVRSNDEIGALSQSFNSMLARLTALKAEEIDHHRDLQAAHAELSLKKILERRVNELQLLYDMARSLNETIELPKLFARISGLVAERLGIPQFSVMLLTTDNVLEVKAAYNKTQSIEGMTFHLGEGAAGRAAQTLTTVYIQDIEKEGSVYVRRNAGPPPTGSLLCIPMVHNDALLGVLNLERPTPNSFPLDEQELLRAVADIFAVATKNALLHEETVELSLTDPLTGASNRRHLFSRLEREVERSQRFGTPLSVLMIDIDHFKHLNDTSGHRAGDEVLRRVAGLLRANVRKLDTVARYGGEEFMVLLPGIGKAEALEVAEKLRETIASTNFENGSTQPLGFVSISVGAANMPLDATGLETLVDCADSALYSCKREGRNKAIAYAPGMELHPGRERGPHAAKRRRTQEIPAVKPGSVTGTDS